MNLDQISRTCLAPCHASPVDARWQQFPLRGCQFRLLCILCVFSKWSCPPPVKYVATNVTRSLFTVALAQGYGTLYRYFSGANEDGISAPVTVRDAFTYKTLAQIQKSVMSTL